jgi:hypothetical protein
MPMNARLLRPLASGGFNPSRLAGLTSWFDANASSTVTLNGSNVSEWRNLVSGGTAFSQTTAADQPPFSTLAGRGAVNLLSGSVHLIGPAIQAVGDTSTNTLLMFFVVQYTGTTTNSRRLLSDASSQGGLFGWYPRYGDGNAYLDFAQTNARVSGSVTSTTISSAPTICRVRRAGANASLHYNATQIASRSNASGNLFTNTTLGLRLQGQDANNSALVGEIVAYNRDLSASEVTSVESFLAEKWGVTL